MKQEVMRKEGVFEREATAVGKIEQYGIDYIPEEHRTGKPINVFYIMAGTCCTLPIIVSGWIPIALGLSWWAAFWAIVFGAIFGAVLLIPMGLLSPVSGTNVAVTSAAHFGVRGRLIGSIVGFVISVLFTALSVWTGGDAIVASLHRLFGMPINTAITLLFYTLITIAIIVVAVFGLATFVWLERIATWTGIPLLLLGVVVLWPNANFGLPAGDYALGGFWPTWIASFIVVALPIVGYGLAIGDWTRYISPVKHRMRSIAFWTFLGGVLGEGGPMLWGAFTAAMFVDRSADYVTTLTTLGPIWWVVCLLYLGALSGSSQGTVNMYTTGLDLASIFTRLSRLRATVIVGLASFTLVVVGTQAGEILTNLTTFLDLTLVAFVSFTSVSAVGFWNHYYQYDVDALQMVVRGEDGGRYWFRKGWNWRALVSFLFGTAMGVMGLNLAWFTGPLVPLMGGIGFGFLLSLSAGLLYGVLLWLFPEDDAVYAAGRRRIGGPVRRPATAPGLVGMEANLAGMEAGPVSPE